MKVNNVSSNSNPSFRGIIKVTNLGYKELLSLRNLLSTAADAGKMGAKGSDYFTYGGRMFTQSGQVKSLPETTVFFFGKDVDMAAAWRKNHNFRIGNGFKLNKDGSKVYKDNPRFFDQLKDYCERITDKSPVYDAQKVVSAYPRTQTEVDKLMTAIKLDKLDINTGKIAGAGKFSDKGNTADVRNYLLNELKASIAEQTVKHKIPADLAV